MSGPVDCCTTCCPTIETSSIPGIQGQSAFTLTTASFVVPPLGNQVTVSVTDTTWLSTGQTIFILGAGYFTVDNINSSTSLLLTYQNVSANTNTGVNIAAGAEVSAAGTPGTDGTPGTNAFTVTTAGFVVPAIGANVSTPDGFIHVADTAFMGVGQNIFVTDGVDFGTFQVVSVPNSTSFVAKFLGFNGEAAPGATIDSGALASPGGNEPALAVALPTAFTDNTGGTPSNTLSVLVGTQTIEFNHTFIGGTAAVEPVTNYVVGFNFEIVSWACVTSLLLVGAAGSRVANMEIGTTDVGTVPSTITIPIANAAVGTVTTGTAVAGANVGTNTDAISIEIANSGTQFTAGSVTFIITIRNMDSVNAISSLGDHINTLILALT